MAKNAIKAQSLEDIKQSLADLLELTFKLKLQKSTQQLKDVNQIKLVRRNVARIKTELRLRGEQ